MALMVDVPPIRRLPAELARKNPVLHERPVEGVSLAAVDTGMHVHLMEPPDELASG